MEPSSTQPFSDVNGHQDPLEGKSEPTEPIDRSEISAPRTKKGKDECYLMLAQVNLLRIRKQPDEAVELCETALRKWPFRADAHALMGDLHQDTGLVDDAILRYCRALELEPNSRPIRKKLADMVKVKRQSLGPATPTSKPATGLRLDRLTRAVILLLATVMLATIMISPAILQKRQRSQPTLDDTTVDRRINLNPIVLQPSAPSPTPTNVQPSTTSTASVIRDPVEQAVVDLMSNDKSLLSLGIQVLDAQEDPLNNGFAITFLDRPATAQDSSKIAILRDCILVAQSAGVRFGARDVRQFTIRCLLLSTPSQPSSSEPTGSISATTSLTFVGTIQRTAVPGANVNLDTSTADQLVAYFTNPWWSSAVQ